MPFCKRALVLRAFGHLIGRVCLNLDLFSLAWLQMFDGRAMPRSQI
jgi:hypothetical protein